MVGVWPLLESGETTPALRDRLVAYAHKAGREAGLFTNWHDPDAGYEERLAAFVDAVLADDTTRKELDGLANAAAEIGMVSALAQVVLRTLSPGVPDTYQGNELWDDSLVDPDNRRPVDWDRRRGLLAELAGVTPSDLWGQRRDGRIKAWVLTTCLRLRGRFDEAFGADGGYVPLATSGTWREHLVAFARTAGSDPRVVAVVPRLAGAVMGHDLAAPLGDRWADTAVALPPGEWVSAFDGRPADGGGIAALFAEVPLAVLVRR
jgi:(1->4)-alpha-D-glucan 1-alpha-D-glucosylmutase